MNTNDYNFTRACTNGQYNIVEMYLNSKTVNIDCEQDDGKLATTPLIMAANRGHVDVVRLLLKHGAKTYSRTLTKEDVLYLLRDGNNPNCRECAALIEADPKPGKKRGWLF